MSHGSEHGSRAICTRCRRCDHHRVSTNPAEKSDPLSDSVCRLIGEVRCLREVLDEIREDLSWVTRNGLPAQTVEHIHVKRMARNVTAVEWNDRLVVERTMLNPSIRLSGLDSIDLDEITEEFRVAVETLAQGQIEPVLNALDEVRQRLIESMQRHSHHQGSEAEEPSDSTPTSPLFPPDEQRPTRVRPDRLF